MQNMINSLKTAAFFNGRQRVRILHHTDHFLISGGIAADVACIVFRQIQANPAKFDLFFDFHNALSQFYHVIFGGAQNIIGQPRGRFLADAGKFAQFGNQLFNRLCICFHKCTLFKIRGY